MLARAAVGLPASARVVHEALSALTLDRLPVRLLSSSRATLSVPDRDQALQCSVFNRLLRWRGHQRGRAKRRTGRAGGDRVRVQSRQRYGGRLVSQYCPCRPWLASPEPGRGGSFQANDGPPQYLPPRNAQRPFWHRGEVCIGNFAQPIFTHGSTQRCCGPAPKARTGRRRVGSGPLGLVPFQPRPRHGHPQGEILADVVLNSSVAWKHESIKQARHALLPRGARDRLSQQRGDGEDANVGGGLGGLGGLDRVGDDERLELRAGDLGYRATR